MSEKTQEQEAIELLEEVSEEITNVAINQKIDNATRAVLQDVAKRIDVFLLDAVAPATDDEVDTYFEDQYEEDDEFDEGNEDELAG